LFFIFKIFKEKFDSSTNRYYYFNVLTRESTWIQPPYFIDVELKENNERNIFEKSSVPKSVQKSSQSNNLSESAVCSNCNSALNNKNMFIFFIDCFREYE
jgi:hypothetical protein